MTCRYMVSFSNTMHEALLNKIKTSNNPITLISDGSTDTRNNHYLVVLFQTLGPVILRTSAICRLTSIFLSYLQTTKFFWKLWKLFSSCLIVMVKQLYCCCIFQEMANIWIIQYFVIILHPCLIPGNYLSFYACIFTTYKMQL